MRTTVSLDDDLLAEASELTGITERAQLLRTALSNLIATESARRLAAMGGSDKAATSARRRRVS